MTSADKNPYVGLRPFFFEDSLLFFGRDQQTAELLTVLRAQRFLGLVGRSGSGKSSLVRAGLLPALYGGFLVGDRDRWRIVQIKPGDTPMRNLAAGLLIAISETPPTDSDIAAFEATIREEHAAAVVALVREQLSSRQSVFLLVDQFEEIFPFRNAGEDARGEANDFVSLIMALADESSDPPMFVALTMRTDFLGDCDLFFGLPEMMNRGQYLVPRLTRQQLRQAIEGPAMLTGARIAPRLIDLLLNKLGDREDRLPVIQHALLRTWDAWRADGATGPIDLSHFQQAGGFEEALNIDAEAALTETTAALPGLDNGVVARVFKCLTETDQGQRAVRRPAHVSELMAAAGADRSTIDAVISCFSQKNRNFVHADGWPKAPDPRVDISHESLIRQWTRLRTWVAEEADKRDQFVSLVARARSWERHGVVLQGAELVSARAWWKSAAPTAAWARRYAVKEDDFAIADRLLTASRSARRRARLSWYAAAAVVIVASIGTLTYVQRREAKTAAATEFLRDKESEAASLVDVDPESAVVAGLLAADQHAVLHPGAVLPPELETILLRAWQNSALVKTQKMAFDGDADYALFSRDGGRVLFAGSSGADGNVKTFDLRDGHLITKVNISEWNCAGFSADATRVNFINGHEASQWSLDTSATSKLAPLTFDNDRSVRMCRYSPDGSKVAIITSKPYDLDFVLTLALVSAGRLTKIRDFPLASHAMGSGVMQFSAKGDGLAVAIAASDTNNLVKIIDTRAGRIIKTLKTSNRVTDIALSPDNSILATVEEAYTYSIILRSTGAIEFAQMLPNSANDDDYDKLVFSPDGERIAAVNGDTARLWNLSSGLDMGSFKAHQRRIFDIAFDAHGDVVTAGLDAEVSYWRAGDREIRVVLPDQDLSSAVIAPSGAFFLTAASNGSAQGWTLDHAEQKFPATFALAGALQLALSRDGRVLAVPTQSKTIVVDGQSGRTLTEIPGGSVTARVALSGNGLHLATIDKNQGAVWTLTAPGANPFRAAEPTALRVKDPQLQFAMAAFSADEAGSQLATVSGRTVFLWNASTGECDGRIDARSQVTAIAYVPGGAELATGDETGRVRMWALADGRAAGCEASANTQPIVPRRTLQEHRAAVRSITFTNDGARFATASDDRSAKVWDTPSGKVLLTLRHARTVTGAEFSSDGKRLLTTVDALGAHVWEVPLRSDIVAFARTRLTRDCLTAAEREKLFPGIPSASLSCAPLPQKAR